MNANDVIEIYIKDVALRLPRRLRNDVAFELRALLGEELQDRAEAAGHAADADMAIGMLRAFGHPVEVASRYQPSLTIIDPADGQRFLRLTVIGLTVIWIAGLVEVFHQADAHSTSLLGLLAQWWLGVVIQSLWWPGVLVVGFALASRMRQRSRGRGEWKPLSSDRVSGGSTALVMAIIGTVAGLTILIDPRWILDLFFGGRAAPQAYTALSWTESFRNLQAPWLFVLVALNVPIFVAVIAKGRWSTAMRRLQDGLALLTCAVMAWAVLDGPIMQATQSDLTIKFCMATIIAWIVLELVWKKFRSVQPNPDHATHFLR